jgi:hypothetical protein
VVGKPIFNTEVAKIQFNTRASDLGGFFSVGELGGHDGVHSTEEEIILSGN